MVRLLIWLFALVLAATGVVLLWGGVRLALLGGSFYYFPAGLVLLATSLLLVLRRGEAAWLYGGLLSITLAWSLAEVGLSPWELVPRIVAPALVGLWFLTPSYRSNIRVDRIELSSLAKAGAFLVPALLGYLVHSDGPPDPIYRMGTIDPGAVQARPVDKESDDWTHWGGDNAGSRFSTLDQITPENVSDLEIIWTYRTGPDPSTGTVTTLPVTPLKVGDTLYLCTNYDDVIALDAEPGQQKWRFQSGSDLQGIPLTSCRGVAYHRARGENGTCAERIISTLLDGYLIALDARSGELCPGFGEQGKASLLSGMGEVTKGYYNVSSAPTIVRGKIVIGGMVADGQYWGEPSGVIRAFDATTGEFSWAFDVGRLDRQAHPTGNDTYTRATPNSWAPMSADEELGLVYAPTGNATPDYFGGQRRSFDDEFSSSVVAIDAESGRLRWSFQTAHHDLWDWDVPAQPTLFDIPTPEGPTPVLIQATKRGEIFVLNRETGEAIAAVEEKPVSQTGGAPEDRLSPTQPFSTGMPSVAGPELTERSMWGLTPIDQMWCRIQFRSIRYEGQFTPPGPTTSIIYPGYGGGSNWGGVAVDESRSILIANASRLPTTIRLMPRAEADELGLKPFDQDGKRDLGGPAPQLNTPYAADVRPFLSPLFTPCTAPPYGTISAIDLASQKLIWTKALGTAAGAGPLGIRIGLPLPMGQVNIGGVLTLESGLTFIGAVSDRQFRAFETATGRVIWKHKLPVPAYAAPMTYQSEQSRRQFIVIAAGGNKALNTDSGDYVVAFALPNTRVRTE